MTPNCEKQRLEGTAELFPVCDNSDGHVKQNLKCSSEHFSSHSHRSHFGLVKWVLETEVKKKPQMVFLKTYLMILADEALEGTLFKAFGFESGL